jgi:hypothetical protein
MYTNFCWHVAAVSFKSAGPILHREPSYKNHINATGDFKKGWRTLVET